MDIYSLENLVFTNLEIQRENTIQLTIGNQDFTLRFVMSLIIILLEKKQFFLKDEVFIDLILVIWNVRDICFMEIEPLDYTK